MSLIYSDSEVGSGGGHMIPYHRQNATKSYLRHYENYLYLQFIQKNSDKESERNQATKELTICERKMKHWQHHANYDQQAALQGIQVLKKQWDKSRDSATK